MFVLLRDVEIGLETSRAPAVAIGQLVLVNRYGVERVAADIMLGFYFPGAASSDVDAGRRRSELAARALGRSLGPPASRDAVRPGRRRTGLRWAWCWALDPGVARRASRAVAARRCDPGTKPSSTVHGMALRSIRWMPRSRSTSSMHTRLMASPVGAGAAGPADAVDVVLRVPRQLEVDDDRQVLDVEAAGGHVGRDEDPDVARLEALQRARPLGLRPVAVDGHRVEALAIEPRGQPRGGQLGPREDEHLAQVACG